MQTDRYTGLPPILAAPELRTALGVVASMARSGGPDSVIRGRVMGHPELVERFREYGEIVHDRVATLVILSADPSDVRTALDESGAERIVTLAK